MTAPPDIAIESQALAVITAFRNMASLDEIKRCLGQALPLIGYAYYTYLAIDIGPRQDRRLALITTDAVALTNIDPAWTKRYVDRHYLDHDPIVHACYKSRSPVIWTIAQTPPNLTPEAEAMLADAASHGINRGITIPIHGFAGELGIFSLYSTRPDDEFLERAQHDELFLQRMAFALHDLIHRRFIQRSAGAEVIDIAIRGPQRPLP